ncbi:hypothetical protein ACQ4PT_030873 [Festuca glaucescens]
MLICWRGTIKGYACRAVSVPVPLPSPKFPTKEDPNPRSAPQYHPLAVADSGVVAAAPPSEFPSPASTKPSTSKLSTHAAVAVTLPTPAAVALATPAGVAPARAPPRVGRSLHRIVHRYHFFVHSAGSTWWHHRDIGIIRALPFLISWSNHFAPDGRKRKCSEAFASENTCTEKGHLLQALVDKYNEDHDLSGDLAYELKDALHCQIMWEGKRNIWYYHFNFITKTKGADGIDILFFAEVTCIEGDELAVSCCCMINTDANGCCYGYTNNGTVGMKHPNQANAYNAGHPGGYLPFGHSGGWDALDDHVEDFKDEEDRIRHIYKGLDDPDTLKKICTPSPYATATFY